MLKAVLFDLDDTLLANDMDVFLPPYFDALSRYTQPRLDSKRFMPALLQSTRAMMEDADPTRTNRAVFWDHFSTLTGLDQADTEPFFNAFYGEEFARLSHFTARVNGATEVVTECLRRGLAVVIATNPIFPLNAIQARMRWAGFEDPAIWALVTSYENMSSTKPNVAYYTEIVQKLGCAPSEALMVGNDPVQDIAPARAAGLHTFWVHNASRRTTAAPVTTQTETSSTLTDVMRLINELHPAED